MGKTRKQSSESPKEESKVAEDEQRYTSDLVKLKVENQKVMDKSIKTMQAEVKQTLEAKQVISAVKALQKYFKDAKDKASKAAKKNLLEEEDGFVHVNFTLTQVPVKPTPRPMAVSIPKAFNTKDNRSRVCVIVKDPEADFRSQIENMDLPCIAEVIGFDRLKRDFKQFADKRQLLKDYDLFLADIRIYKMLPEMLGKAFYDKKAYPCPIKLHGLGSDAKLAEALNSAAADAYFTMGNGPNYSCKIAKISMDSKDIAKNLEAAVGQALGYTCCWDSIPFARVSQISVRVGSSIELPVFNQFSALELDAYMEQH